MRVDDWISSRIVRLLQFGVFVGQSNQSLAVAITHRLEGAGCGQMSFFFSQFGFELRRGRILSGSVLRCLAVVQNY